MFNYVPTHLKEYKYNVERKCKTNNTKPYGYVEHWNDPLKLHKSEQADQSVLRGVRG
jgi:hypothetical protein